MSLYGGIDLHANTSVVVLLNEQDRVIYQKRLPNALSTILEACAPHSSAIEGFVVESTYNWYWLVDGLMEAAQFALRFNARAQRFYQRKLAKSNNNMVLARKTVAHKLARACYYIMPALVPFDAMKAFG
jgi:hypothetical protein